MERRINDDDIILLADLLDWNERGTLRQSQSANKIWATVHFEKPDKGIPGANNDKPQG